MNPKKQIRANIYIGHERSEEARIYRKLLKKGKNISQIFKYFLKITINKPEYRSIKQELILLKYLESKKELAGIVQTIEGLRLDWEELDSKVSLDDYAEQYQGR
jgi:hypothetical protein